jgi:hypothetical protein
MQALRERLSFSPGFLEARNWPTLQEFGAGNDLLIGTPKT